MLSRAMPATAPRATAPMVAAQDAVLIDTSHLSLSAAIAQAIAAVEQEFPYEKP